ncbi:hypothetical protein GCWU000325_00862 [Alloprevotella tannerae ATCC 51259]|uniref:Uncharacterized protein n=1 Tax=Alloprevotella tannerae ATCC 51259 TaxID=626522 RepID=C9LF81_9BACT|nr:hypothetical protein GCWU000325_00862 [Alloprevotella tannerae ATCC 51259]
MLFHCFGLNVLSCFRPQRYKEKKRNRIEIHKIILQRSYFSGYHLLFSTLSALFRTS